MIKFGTRSLKFLAVLMVNGTGKVIPVGSANLNRTITDQWAIGNKVIGEYGMRHLAERALRLTRRGRPPRNFSGFDSSARFSSRIIPPFAMTPDLRP
jgi:hypothetical protein